MADAIELVLITGAGASTAFGTNRDPLPVMRTFSDLITNRLHEKVGYLEATDLTSGLAGDEFERRLGGFLRGVAAFEQIPSLVPATAAFLGSPPPPTSDTLEQWYRTSLSHLHEIVEDIYRVTFDSFNIDRVAVTAAATAYGTLLTALNLRPSHSVVVATTNYDQVVEYALDQAGWRPDAGDPRYTNTADPSITVDGLLNGMPGDVPVLHLHGRLGWYRRPSSETIYVTDNRRHDPNFGIPVLVLPDPQKSYAGDAAIASLWSQFEIALRRAKRVLVLGHSLNDTSLVDALRRNVPQGSRVAVTALPGDNAMIARIPVDLPGATAIELPFKEAFIPPARLGLWLTETERMGPPPTL
jgi:hypothetical protein